MFATKKATEYFISISLSYSIVTILCHTTFIIIYYITNTFLE
nr:MAG TPA: hypothetical protein [Caudoviricetes sp.]